MPKARPDDVCPGAEHTTNTHAGSGGLDAPVSTERAAAADRLRDLNDRLRRDGIGGRVMVTRGIACLGQQRQRAIIEAVRRFGDFSPRNDPYGEHDCAVVEVDGLSVIWKIDAYDLSMTMGSPDPLDPAATCRVLTIMLADEY
ncbi:MAG: DUF3768 domain-containing protein [Xanthobacteraceae bacterium]|nr:DUF3768 domain-containing protein [Xanthobacteraceae bacterium]